MTGDRPTVLVVDDEEDLADLYAAWLTEEYDVRVAYGGEAASERLDEVVDVALIDRLMPDRSGDDVLSEIRERELDCRVAMVTAVEPDFDIVEMGFDDYLVKPIDRERLLDAVGRLLARSAYDEQVRGLFALAAKRATLEAQKTERELEASDAYAELTARIERLREELDETVADFEGRDFEVVMRQLDGGDRPEADLEYDGDGDGTGEWPP